MKILDLTAGNRAIWFNKRHPLTTYLDKREEVLPDIVCDTNQGIPGSGYTLVCWDPPHMNCGPNSNMSKSYGYHRTAEILETIRTTGRHLHTVTEKDALLAFKWNDHDISLLKIFKLLPRWEPLFGHLTKDGAHSQTYWVLFRRLEKSFER